MRNKGDNIIREQVDEIGRPTIDMLYGEIARMERNEAYRKLAFSFLKIIITAAAIITLITNFWLAVLQIDGSSMNPTLQMDEIVLAVRTDNSVKNDIIVFTNNNKTYVKRVIAVSGDLVEINHEGIVSVNGEVLDESYVTEKSLGTCDIEFPFIVPTGTVFVLGDNRAASVDSRDSKFSTVNREQIIGKVVFSIWPPSEIGSVS